MTRPSCYLAILFASTAMLATTACRTTVVQPAPVQPVSQPEPDHHDDHHDDHRDPPPPPPDRHDDHR